MFIAMWENELKDAGFVMDWTLNVWGKYTRTFEYQGKNASSPTNGGNGGCGGTGGDPGKVYLIGFADSRNFDVHCEAGK